VAVAGVEARGGQPGAGGSERQESVTSAALERAEGS
jgi:hypothetical protein